MPASQAQVSFSTNSDPTCRVLSGADYSVESLCAPARPPPARRTRTRPPGGLDIFTGPPTLAALSKAFANPYAMAGAWAHFITFDLFVGRWILFDSIRNRVFAVHSLILANLLGPVGLLSHLLTREVVRGGRPRDALADGVCDEMSDENLLRLVDD